MSRPQDDKEAGVVLAPYRYASPSAEPMLTPEENPKTRLSKDGTRIILRRTGKPHVSSACLHCRKSHLACDKSRPCNRCITAGRANDCYDTQHKKRGRPKTNPSHSSMTDSSGSSRQDAATKDLDAAYPSPRRHKNSPHIKRLSPLLPLFEPKHDPRSVLDLLHPKTTPSPDQESKALELMLDGEAKCLQVDGPNSFLGIDTGQFIHSSLYTWIHPDDCFKLTQALKALTSRRLAASATPSSQVRLHLLNKSEHHELVDMTLSPGPELGFTKCEITRFNLEALLRQAPPGDTSLFQ
ncbi:hypothetical protein DSO57_1018521 [Entomophthora muscae]|uniref:Uncharacterized protein n=1 Tax=Entomophthora muscae TaxID=34485 RepID=A0ACC2T4F5_9FUNG|nr:hypothetical protein DSO57_1018521 [Entomophthora muscae]